MVAQIAVKMSSNNGTRFSGRVVPRILKVLISWFDRSIWTQTATILDIIDSAFENCF